jgi:parallel beta-helix repeat protein
MDAITPDPHANPPDRAHTRRRALGLAGVAAAGLVASGASAGRAAAAGTGPVIVVDAAGGGDYTDLEAAVAAAQPDSLIQVRPGNYPIKNGVMNPAAGVVIQGSGYGTHLRAVNALNKAIFRVYGDHVVIRDLRIDGNGANQNQSSSNCVAWRGAYGKLLDCFIHDASGYNVVGEPGADHWVVEGNQSYSTLGTSIAVPREGIELQGVSYCAVVGNVVEGVAQNGILLWNSSGDCGFNTVAGNTVRGCRRAGIGLEDGAHDNSVSANTVSSCNWGIYGTNNGSSGAPHHNAITGNTVFSCSNGVQIEGGAGTVFADNVVRAITGGNGVTLLNTRGASVTGNTSSGNSLAGFLIQDSVDSVCSGNVAYDNGQNTASDNRRAGVVLNQYQGACANNVVTGNRCYDSQGAKTQLYGIALFNKCDNNVVSENVLDGNGARGLLLSNGPTNVMAAGVRKIAVTVGAGVTAVQHGLSYVPNVVSVSMTSPGDIWRAAGSTTTTIYLRADAPGRTADVLVG